MDLAPARTKRHGPELGGVLLFFCASAPVITAHMKEFPRGSIAESSGNSMTKKAPTLSQVPGLFVFAAAS
jgi:hypothetical protein